MKPFRIILPLIVLLACGWVANYLVTHQPEARRWNAPAAQLNVEAARVAKTSYDVIVESQGVVRARTESTLIPEIAGRIVRVSPEFLDGGFFEKGDILVEIDPSDYQTAVVVAKASLAQAESALQQEVAMAAQALENWKSLGNDAKKASPLALREPQLAQARANVESARARIEEAERDLVRTTIKAPYAGRILQKLVDIGQYVSPGTVMARIYAIDYAEVRLPLSDEQLAFVDVQERYRGEKAAPTKEGPKVTLRGRVGLGEAVWEGRVVRTEGAFDASSRQLFVIAQIDDPYGRKRKDSPPLKVGQFVEAEIAGERLQDVFVIPRSALRGSGEVLIIDEANKFHRNQLDIVWSDEHNAVAREGLRERDLLCLTQVPFAADGALCIPDIEGEGKRVLEGQGGGKGKGKGKGGKGAPGGKGGKSAAKGAPGKAAKGDSQ